MRKQILKTFVFALFIMLSAAVVDTSAQRRAYNVSDAELQSLLSRIETKTDSFKVDMNTALDRSRLNNTETEDRVNGYIADFESATDSLSQRFNSRRSVSSDAQEVLSRAAFINQFISDNRLGASVRRSWNALQADLDTLARYYSVSWNWTNTPTTGGQFPTNQPLPPTTGSVPYRVRDREVSDLLARLDTRTDAYRREMTMAFDRSVLNNTRSENTLITYISDFETAVDTLKQRFDTRRSVGTDVEEVLNRAAFIDSMMRDYRFGANAESQWRLIRTDLSTLSTYYSVNWDWNRRGNNRLDNMLTGTYRLNVEQSDSVAEVVNRASTTYYGGAQQDRQRRNLERRLTAPDMLVIEKRGNDVTIASSTAPQVTFAADGVARTETNQRGRTVKVTATTTYDGVGLSYEGERANDFYVNFMPLGNNQLRVVRRVYIENRNETVTVASIYDKIDNVARWSDVNNNQNIGSNNNTGLSNDFIVPNNTRLIASLETPISTRTAQNGDRFQMRVTSPSEYNGAIIEGRVAKAERSGRVSGRANVSLEFDTISMNGRTYRFAGFVDNVTLASGEKVTVNNEGTVRDNNQTTKTATRAGIGAALGALIGAIAGGGQGAAVGAAIGAGAGAGTVIAQGRDDVELVTGSEFSITATAPSNINR